MQMGEVDEVRRLEGEVARLREELRAAHRGTTGLSDSESRYRALFNALAEGVVVQAHDGTILASNEAAQEILGLTQDQLAGRTSLDPRWRAIRENGEEYSGEDHPAMVTLRTGLPVRRAIMGVHKPDGSVSWISINTQTVPVAGASGVVSSFTDVTALRSAKEDLARNEALFRLALSAAKVGVWEWTVGTEQLTWSDEVYDLFALPRGEAVTFERYQSRIHPDDREMLARKIEQALSVPENGGVYQVEHRTKPEPGLPLRWIRGTGQVLYNESKQPVLMRGAVMDVTDQRLMGERTLRSGRMESIGRLAGGVAHDFNNLLTAILGAVDQGLSQLESRANVEASFQTIEKASAHAAALTRQLLAFAKRQSLVLESCNLDELLEDSKGLLRHLLGEGVELAMHQGAGGWHARLDPTQIQQVLLNLAANANDAMKKGGRLEISVVQVHAGDPRLAPEEADQDWLLLVIEDSGEGMSEEVRKRVFDPFFTTKEAGTGLGLATSYGIVEQSGGRIECSSTRGQGTRFSIFLPRFLPLADAKGASADGKGGAAVARVLVAEDQKSILRLIGQGLGRAGFIAKTASSAEEAVELLEAGGRFDLLLSDVVMPQMSGVELARIARRLHPAIEVVFMSGFAPDLEGIEEISRHPLIEKPFRVSVLVAELTRVLESHRPREQGELDSAVG